MVPLVVSTWLLITAKVPSARGVFPSVVIAMTFSGATAWAAMIAGNWSSGAVKITAIGSTWATVTMPVCVAALTILPISTWRSPTTPEIGDFTAV